MKKITDQEWLARNLKKLINRYGGEYVFIANHKVFSVDEYNIVAVEKELKRKFGIPPIGMPIPKKGDLVSILICQ